MKHDVVVLTLYFEEVQTMRNSVCHNSVCDRSRDFTVMWIGIPDPPNHVPYQSFRHVEAHLILMSWKQCKGSPYYIAGFLSILMKQLPENPKLNKKWWTVL